MLVQIVDLKRALGLPETDDPVADPIFTRSSILAQDLVSGYVGFPVERSDDTPHSYYGENAQDVRVIRLPMYPASLLNFEIDGQEVATDQYYYTERLGTISFYVPRVRIKTYLVEYFPGFDPEAVPTDITVAISNIALGLYARNGNLQPAAASGALKSLTMFDAMSMSFDVGTTTADSSTPEGILKQWAFMLDRYRVDKYVMG